jgi:hypothetical protein
MKRNNKSGRFNSSCTVEFSLYTPSETDEESQVNEYSVDVDFSGYHQEGRTSSWESDDDYYGWTELDEFKITQAYQDGEAIELTEGTDLYEQAMAEVWGYLNDNLSKLIEGIEEDDY